MNNTNLTIGEFLAQHRTKLTPSDRTFGCDGNTYLMRESAAGVWMHGRGRHMVYRGTATPGAFHATHVLTPDDLTPQDRKMLQNVGLQYTGPDMSPVGTHLLTPRNVSEKYAQEYTPDEL